MSAHRRSTVNLGNNCRPPEGAILGEYWTYVILTSDPASSIWQDSLIRKCVAAETTCVHTMTPTWGRGARSGLGTVGPIGVPASAGPHQG